MKKNSCDELIGIIRSEGGAYNPPSIQLGNILSVKPLLIKTNDMQLEKNDILINSQLLKNNISIKYSDSNFKNATIDTILNVGDTVALVPTTDYQTYIVFCKVI